MSKLSTITCRDHLKIMLRDTSLADKLKSSLHNNNKTGENLNQWAD